MVHGLETWCRARHATLKLACLPLCGGSPFPCVHQERRKELSKKVAKMGEDGKVAVRNIRKDILKRLDK